MIAVLAPAKSFVADFVIMAAKGEAFEELNLDVFNAAVEALREKEANDDPIFNFEDVYPFLVENKWGAEDVFNCPVTEETIEAYVAYLCYAI